jgi:hypothetical protein
MTDRTICRALAGTAMGTPQPDEPTADVIHSSSYLRRCPQIRERNQHAAPAMPTHGSIPALSPFLINPASLTR